MLQLHGLLLSPPDELPPSEGFNTPTQLLTVFAESAGEVFKLTATEEAAAALADAKTPCPVVLEVRATSLSLAEISGGARKGRAYKLRVLRAALAQGGRS